MLFHWDDWSEGEIQSETIHRQWQNWWHQDKWLSRTTRIGKIFWAYDSLIRKQTARQLSTSQKQDENGGTGVDYGGTVTNGKERTCRMCWPGDKSLVIRHLDDDVVTTAAAVLAWKWSRNVQPSGIITSCMNFLQTGRMSLDRVAENIITCFECGVARKISWMSRRMSAHDTSALAAMLSTSTLLTPITRGGGAGNSEKTHINYKKSNCSQNWNLFCRVLPLQFETLILTACPHSSQC